MLKPFSSHALCRAIHIRFASGGEFLLWAAGTEQPREGLQALFTHAKDSFVYSGRLSGASDQTAPIVVDEEAESRGRCVLTLYEHVNYVWRSSEPGFKPVSSLSDSAQKADWTVHREAEGWGGQFRVMNHLGIAWIEIGPVRIRFEIQTRKLDYETEYRRMVESIAGECQQLLLEWDSPVAMHLSTDPDRSARTLLERFLFLRHVLAPDRIDFFLELVRRRPHTQLVEESRWEPTACAGPVAFHGDPFAFGRGWQSVGRGNGLAGSGWMPSDVRTERKFETLDTPPNRFLKFALGQFRVTCEDVLLSAQANEWTMASAEARELRDRLDASLDDPFFEEVGPMVRLPLDSQVLQKREGYRDILLAWLMHDAAARLNWPGHAEAYDGPNRSVAELYEYWLFFRLRRVLKSSPLAMRELPGEKGHVDPAQPFVEMNEDGLQVRLRENEESLCRFDWSGPGRRLRVHLFYNRRFSRSGQPGIRGSYTRPLRPDYTIVLLPMDLAEGVAWDEAEARAEKEGRIAYLHFDAKYRIDKLSGLFGDPQEQDDPDRNVNSASYKRADLYKMHTYADAIRRTSGAYVLYPGTESSRDGLYEEILPGVGAFPMRPHDEALEQREGLALAEFLRAAFQHHVNEFSRDYRIRHWTTRTIRETNPATGSGGMPEVLKDSVPPADLVVLKGFVRSEDEELVRAKRVFFYHAIEADGRPVEIDTSVFDAEILVPYRRGAWLGWWAKIRTRELLQRDALAKRLGTSPERHAALYYYLLELDEPCAFDALGTVPNSGKPKTCSWDAL